MPLADDAVVVEGLAEFRRALRKYGGKELTKQLRLANKEAAADVVLPQAQTEAPAISGDLRRSLKALARQTDARIKGGNAKVPYAAVIHFGWPRRNIAPNHFIYRAVAIRNREFREVYAKRMADLGKQFTDHMTSKGAAVGR